MHPMRKKEVKTKTGLYLAIIFSFCSIRAFVILSSFPKVRRFSTPPFPMIRKELQRELYIFQSRSRGVEKKLKKMTPIWNADSYWPSLSVQFLRGKINA